MLFFFPPQKEPKSANDLTLYIRDILNAVLREAYPKDIRFFYTNTILNVHPTVAPTGTPFSRKKVECWVKAATNKKLKICFLTNLKIYLIKKDSTTMSTIFYNLINIKNIYFNTNLFKYS